MTSTDSDFPLLVSEHDTWISVEPLIGCPAKCGYCYLNQIGITAQRPIIRATVNNTLDALTSYLKTSTGGTRSDLTPVSIGNYTDMCMTETGRVYLEEFLREYACRRINRVVCLVTKAKLAPTFLRTIAACEVPIVFFLSQSFGFESGTRLELGAVSSPEQTLQNAQLVSEQPNLSVVHFWRPFLAALNPLDKLVRRVEELRSAGCQCSVVIGLKGEVTNANLHGLIGATDRRTLSGDELFANDMWNDLSQIARDTGYPLFRHTSCAIALARHEAEALGTWSASKAADKCIPCSCPAQQRSRCAMRRGEAKSSIALNALVAPELGSASWELIDSIDGPAIKIEGSLNEFAYNRLHHIVGVPVITDGITRQKAWLGAFSSGSPLQTDSFND